MGWLLLFDLRLFSLVFVLWLLVALLLAFCFGWIVSSCWWFLVNSVDDYSSLLCSLLMLVVIVGVMV